MAGQGFTKRKIVDAAWELFHEKGYHDTTIEDIIAASGTSKGTFYHYFTGKDSLLSSLSDYFDEFYQQIMADLPPEQNSWQRLVNLCCRAHQMIGERIAPELLASMYSSQVVTRGDKHLLNQNRYYFRIVQQIIDEGQRRGEISNDMPCYEVARYYAMCERAIIYEYCISDANFDLGEFTGRTIPLLLAGLKGQDK